METLKNWPEPLKRNAAICELASAIFKARGECFGGSTTLTDQPPHVRQQYITRADELLKTVQPEPVPAHVAPIAAVRSADGLFNFAASLARQSFVTGLRTTDSNVIGVIGPKEGA